MARRCRRACWLVLALLLGSPAWAQVASTSQSFPEHGLKLDLPRDYKWLAVQPNEDWVVLQWLNPRLEVPSRLQMVRIDYVADSGPPPMDEETETAPALQINSWYRYLNQKLPAWKGELLEVGAPQDGYKVREFELRHGRRPGERGWVQVWEQRAKRSFALIGWAKTDVYASQLKLWRQMARRVKLGEPEADPRVEDWRRHYASRPRLLDAEYRMRVRASLQGDWRFEDTDHYIVVYNTKDKPLISRIVRDLESLRKVFVDLFPPLHEVSAVSTVRVCTDRQEYLDYGGKEWSEGYWSAETKELVLYDSTLRGKAQKTDRSAAYIVLYHEAFHQFIHYSAGQLAPHPWFDEGYGDYFGGAQLKGGKLQRVEPNGWRLPLIQRQLKEGSFLPWKNLIGYERERYYGDSMAQAYAQGWSMVYFLSECSVVRKRQEWAGILPKYFHELKESWDNEFGVLQGDGRLDDAEALLAAQRRARVRALETAFEDVDFQAIEAAWSKYILSLKLR
jgi:hypothetical protein